MNDTTNDEAQAPRNARHRVTEREIAAAADPDALITFQVAAALSGYSVKTLRLWSKTGHRGFPPAVQLGRQVRLRASPFRAWLQAVAAE